MGDLGYDSLYDLNADSRIDALDVDLLMSTMYQPLVPPPAPIVLDSGAGSESADGVEGLEDPIADVDKVTEDALGHADELAALDALFETDPLGSV